MSLISYKFRHEKSVFNMILKTSTDLIELHRAVKRKINLQEDDNILLLYPTPHGTMQEVNSLSDFEIMKKAKLSWNILNTGAYCCVEIVIIVLDRNQPTDESKPFTGQLRTYYDNMKVFRDALHSFKEITDDYMSSFYISIHGLDTDQSARESPQSPDFIGKPTRDMIYNRGTYAYLDSPTEALINNNTWTEEDWGADNEAVQRKSSPKPIDSDDYEDNE